MIHQLSVKRDSGFNYSLNKMAELMGGFNHATVIHAIRKFEDEIEYNPDFRFDVDNFLKIIGLQATKINGRYRLQILQNETFSD